MNRLNSLFGRPIVDESKRKNSQPQEQSQQSCSYYDDFQIHQTNAPIAALKVVDSTNIIYASHKELIRINIDVGTVSESILNHTSAIKLLEVIPSRSGPLIVSVDNDNLMAIRYVENEAWVKYYTYKRKDSPNLSFIVHCSNPSETDYINIMCGHTELVMCTVRLNDPKDEISDEIAHECATASGKKRILKVLDLKQYVVCLEEHSITSFKKSFIRPAEVAKLEYRFSASSSLVPYDSNLHVIGLSELLFCVGTSKGSLYKADCTNLSMKLLHHDRSNQPVNALLLLSENLLAAGIDKKILLIDTKAESLLFSQPCALPITSLVSPNRKMIVTCGNIQSVSPGDDNKDSRDLPLEFWELDENQHHDSKRKDGVKTLRLITRCSFHDGPILGMACLDNGLITYGADNLIIIARNKDEVMQWYIAKIIQHKSKHGF